MSNNKKGPIKACTRGLLPRGAAIVTSTASGLVAMRLRLLLLPLLLMKPLEASVFAVENETASMTQPMTVAAANTSFQSTQQPPFPAQPYELFWTLGNAHAWAPTPYNVSQFGFTSGDCGATLPPGDGPGSFCYGNTWTRDLGATQKLGFPALYLEDRGADGEPCAGGPDQNGNFRGPCDNHSWAPTCEYLRVDTGTEMGAMCCHPGGCAPQDSNVSEILTNVGS